MKKFLIVGSLVIVGVMVFGAVGYASAQTLLPGFFGSRMMSNWTNGVGMMNGKGGNWGADVAGENIQTGMMANGSMNEYMEAALAEAVGLTEEDIEARFANGESYYDIALAQGFSAEEIPALLTEARTTALNQMVADGLITQDQATLMLERMANGMGNGFSNGMMGGYGSAMGSRGSYGEMRSGEGDGLLHDYMVAGFAAAFEMSVDELQARLDAGETMYDVATSLGWTHEQFTTTMQTVRTEAINQAVADGVITQAQAEWMLAHMTQMRENGYGPGSQGAYGGGNGSCPMGGGGSGGGFGGGRRP